MGAQSDKRFNAAIFFTVTARIGHELDKVGIWRAFQLADATAPWESRYASGELAPSIYWYSDVKFVREGDGVDRIYELEIRPHFLLAQQAIFAYEKYGIRLAEIVSALRLEGVISVAARVRFDSVNTAYRVGEIPSTCGVCGSDMIILGRTNHCRNGHEA